MKTDKKCLTDIVARIIVLLLILCFGWILLRWGTENILVGTLHMQNAFTDAVMEKKETGLPDGVSTPSSIGVNWAAMFPFAASEADSDAAADAESPKVPLLAGIQEKYNWVIAKKENLSEYIPDNMIFSDWINQTGALYNRILGWEIPAVDGSNNVVSLGDGYYTSLLIRHDAAYTADCIRDFQTFLQEQDIPLVYVAAPRKITQEDTKICGVVDFSVQNMDALLEALEARQIPTVDMRAAIQEKYENFHEAFFKTDVHWTPQTAMFAAGQTAKYLNENFGFGIDLSLYEEDNFDYEIYEDRLLGSEGRKLTTAVADPEDFTLMYPKTDMQFSISILNRKVNKTGGFEVFYDYSQVLGNMEYYDRMAYEAYLYSGNPLTEIDNASNTQGKKVLMLCDSFGRTFAPFFAMGVSRLEVIDLRQFTGSLETYIRDFAPYDAVLIVYNVGSVDYTELIDFR